jgi:hypothetical protein
MWINPPTWNAKNPSNHRISKTTTIVYSIRVSPFQIVSRVSCEVRGRNARAGVAVTLHRVTTAKAIDVPAAVWERGVPVSKSVFSRAFSVIIPSRVRHWDWGPPHFEVTTRPGRFP